MHLTKFLSLPWRDEAEGEFDTIENQSEANPAVPRPTVSDTDLTTDPSTSQNQKSSGGHHTRIRSIFGKIQCKGVKPIHTDVLPSLKLITEGLSDNVRHSDEKMWYLHPTEAFLLRVERLAESFSMPTPEGDTEEEKRRAILKRKLDEVLQDPIPLAGLIEDIREAMVEYQASLREDIYSKSWRLVGDADRSLLNRMHRAVDAGHHSRGRQGCPKGTRRGILLELEEWLKYEKDRRVLWLSGPAGSGKSAIAQTFAEICFADGTLGASFFCSRESSDRCNIQLVLPTIALQLSHWYPRFRKELLKLLRKNPDIGQESIESQVAKLIVLPLEATQIKTLIIIDALDECEDRGKYYYYSTILFELAKRVDRIPNVKFFFADRPCSNLGSGFHLPLLSEVNRMLFLWKESYFVVDGSTQSETKLQ